MCIYSSRKYRWHTSSEVPFICTNLAKIVEKELYLTHAETVSPARDSLPKLRFASFASTAILCDKVSLSALVMKTTIARLDFDSVLYKSSKEQNDSLSYI